MREEIIKVLDHGFVRFVNSMGDDLTVVNSARVSFGKHKNKLDKSDEKLIKYLIDHKHFSPLRHVQLQFHCKMPEFVARQSFKHIVGSAYSGDGWNELCYSSDTEVLTESGFKFWNDVTEEDKLAAVDLESNTYKFEKPSHLYKNYYNGNMVRMYSRDLNSLTTPAHRNFTKYYTGHKNTDGWSQFITRTSIDIHNSLNKFEKLPKLPSMFMDTGTQEDYNLGKLLGFTLGDGGKSTDNKRLYYHVKKQRKKQILEEFAALELITITNRDAQDGYYYARLNIDSPIFTGCYELAKNKYIPWEVIPKNTMFLKGLLNGLMSSDGHITNKNNWLYSTISKNLKEDIIQLCTFLGREVTTHEKSEIYKLTLKHGRHKLIKKTELVPYEGDVHCASVSTGVLLVRRDGKTFVSGNSMRYVDLSDFDFYLPKEFRKQAKINKQGSTDELINPKITPDEENDKDVKTPLNVLVDFNSKESLKLYKIMIREGVAREQARMVLPLNIYTEFYWTVSLQALGNFIKLREESSSQWEIQQYALALKKLVTPICPVSILHLLGDET